MGFAWSMLAILVPVLTSLAVLGSIVIPYGPYIATGLIATPLILIARKREKKGPPRQAEGWFIPAEVKE